MIDSLMQRMQALCSVALVCLTGLLPFGSVQALSNGDALLFFPAVNPDSGPGSKFGMEVGPGFVLYTAIESHNGILLGTVQPAAGSHSGFPDGSEEPDIDKPWSFFANTGMHQTTVDPVLVVDNDGAGNFTLDFAGWGVTWNSIPDIPLGGDPANFPDDTGLATLTCGSTACSVGDAYILDYSAHVPLGDPSGFGGVKYLLHLEGTIGVAPPPGLDVSIRIPGGTEQECTMHGGTEVELIADASVPPGDAIASITWSVDGAVAGQGGSIMPLLAVGDHLVAVALQTENGLSAVDGAELSIQDTTRPVVSADFVSTSTGEAVTVIDGGRRLSLRIEATDVCDPFPEITDASVEKNNRVDVENGDIVMALPNGGTNIHDLGESLRLQVAARDASGNFSSTSTVLQVTK